MKYFIAGFLLMLIGMLAFILIVYQTDLRRHVDITPIHIADAKKELLNECYDIYLIGDSSGNGIDPDLISEELGKKTVNLAMTANMGWGPYESIIRDIKARQCNPELIVIYLTARAIYFDASKKGTFDGLYTNLLFGGIGEFSKYLALHIRLIPRTVLTTVRYFKPEPFPYKLDEYYNQSLRQDIDHDIGADCAIHHDLSDGKDLQAFAAYKQDLTAILDDTRFVFVAAPLPECTENKEEIEPVNQYVDKAVDYMDNLYFRDYTHLSRKGVKPATQRVIQAIRDAGS